MTEQEFYKAVQAACEAEGITCPMARGYVEMTCIDNAYDASTADYWAAAHRTLEFFVASGDLVAASRNER